MTVTRVSVAAGVASGALDGAAVRDAYAFHLSHVQWMVGVARQRNPAWTGTVRMLLTTDGYGRVLAARVVGGTLAGVDPISEQDVLWHATGVRFPETSDGRPAQLLIELHVGEGAAR